MKVYIHRSIEQTEGPEKDSHKKSQLIFFYKGTKAINGEKTVFSISEQMGLEQLDVHIPKEKSQSILHSIQKSTEGVWQT